MSGSQNYIIFNKKNYCDIVRIDRMNISVGLSKSQCNKFPNGKTKGNKELTSIRTPHRS